MKKISLLILLILAAAMLLCACEATDDSSDDIDSPPAVDDIKLVEAGATAYRIVRSDYASSALDYQGAINLANYMQACGVDIKVTTDWEKNGVSDYEIIVGESNRGEVYDKHLLGEEGFVIKAVGSRIHIIGGSAQATINAVDHFIGEYMGFSGDYKSGKHDGSDVIIPGDFEYIQKQTYDVTDIKLGSRSLVEYSLDAATKSLEAQAEAFRDYIYKLSGIWLEVNSDDDRPTITFAESGGDKFTLRRDGDNYVAESTAPDGISRGLAYLYKEHFTEKTGELIMEEYTKEFGGYVFYEEFGAVGDGVTNDMPAIIATHEFANKNDIKVRANDAATYYIGKSADYATIQTDTDWGTAKFIIDDRGLDNISVAVFTITSKRTSQAVGLTSLKQGQENIGVTLNDDSFVILTNDTVRRYIRYGVNANDGAAQTEGILVAKDGTVDPSTPIVWDYDTVTSATAYPVDTETLTVRGGIFTTIIDPTHKEFTYYGRGIVVRRSNTVVEKITHYTENEEANGSAYGGFVNVTLCANVVVRDSLFTPHMTFRSIRPGETDEFTMGTYDLAANRAVNLTFLRCKQTVDIMDTKYWGILGTNYCKNLVYDSCELSRFDAHCGVANASIVNSTIGFAGINAVGFGTLLVENTTVMGTNVVNLRTDYGSTWQGDIVIRNVTFKPRFNHANLIGGANNGQHDFGYQCYLPTNVIVEDLYLQNEGKIISTLCVFADMNSENTSDAYVEPYPYVMCEKANIKGFNADKAVDIKLSPNEYMFRDVELSVIS